VQLQVQSRNILSIEEHDQTSFKTIILQFGGTDADQRIDLRDLFNANYLEQSMVLKNKTMVLCQNNATDFIYYNI